jgi:hypothetical protein
MVNLRQQKRLAASVAGVGKRKSERSYADEANFFLFFRDGVAKWWLEPSVVG